MQEPLLKGSHELEIGQKVRVVDTDILEQWNAVYSDQAGHLVGYISDIDEQDIQISVRPDVKFGFFWNIDFSVKWN
jgi:hypothetical protein